MIRTWTEQDVLDFGSARNPDTYTERWEDPPMAPSTELSTREYEVTMHLYSAHPEYAARLVLLARSIGMTPWSVSSPRCLIPLARPTHKHASNDCSGRGSAKILNQGRGLDHMVWFRRPDGGQWALLSQDYAREPHVIEAIECDHVVLLDSAPYGMGTVGTLYVGREKATS